MWRTTAAVLACGRTPIFYEIGDGRPAIPRILAVVVKTRTALERHGRGLPVADLHHVPAFTKVRGPRHDFPGADWYPPLAPRRLTTGIAFVPHPVSPRRLALYV